ncbi:MAG: VOC family protein [Defluviitaleaceae bacterium]|nr:VOC family protein [Defluviitaleaceae bacterium]
MQKGILGTSVVVQIGFVVHDIEAAAKDFADMLGLDAPRANLTAPLEEAQTVYRGAPSEARAKLAFLNVGPNVTIELIEPDHEPSTWREELDARGEGVHHIAFQIKGMKEKIAALEGEGLALLQKGEYAGGRYAYVDARSKLKTIIELLEND